MAGEGEGNSSTNDEIETLRLQFLEEATLELEADFEISADIAKSGILVKLLGNRSFSRNRIKQILSEVWSFLKGPWKIKTLEKGLWGFFFDNELDKKEILKRRPWLISNQILNVRDWPKDGSWQKVCMTKAAVWVQIHGLPTPFLVAQNSKVIGTKVGEFIESDGADNRVIARRDYLKLRGRRIDDVAPSGLGDVMHSTEGTSGVAATTKVGQNGTVGTLQISNVTAGPDPSIKVANKAQRKTPCSGPIHPMVELGENSKDANIIMSLMPNVGPTASQMIDIPQHELCKSRTPHHHPEPIIIQNPNSPAQSSKTPPKWFHTDRALESTGGKKRKAGGNVAPVLLQTEGKAPSHDTRPVNEEITSNLIFAVGSHESPGTGKGGSLTKPKHGSSKSNQRNKKKGIRAKAPGLRSVADLLFRRTKQWNSNYLCYLFGVELGTKISTIQIATDLNEDLLIWKQSNNGNFSVKQAYLLNQGGRFGAIDPLWKWIWHGELHPRMRMTLWRALSGALPLGGKAGIPSNNCCFCPNLEENTLHLFVKCSFAAGLWFGSPVPLCTNAVHSDSLKSFVIEMGSNLDCAQRTRFLLCLAVIIDTIWNKRNALWHNVDEQAVNIGESLDSIHRKFWELSQIDEHGDTMSMAPASPPSELQNLPTGNRLIFVDGSFKEGKIGAGILAWDRATMDWFFEAKVSDGMSEVAAEVFAWFSAFQWAKKNNWDDFALISDSSILISRVPPLEDSMINCSTNNDNQNKSPLSVAKG
ncbi:hypothetical protein G4B88_003614 [Cannabis sativa]|uniref:Reverse transcriptase zinc-binding domain-containing protein n=1 Tax=Cannabis sativa TaxID=3483 RepID=A0A7J6FDH9_CANSA|nr:hypothetical protein G4B88_003614 [Cannabis sativa]